MSDKLKVCVLPAILFIAVGCTEENATSLMDSGAKTEEITISQNVHLHQKVLQTEESVIPSKKVTTTFNRPKLAGEEVVVKNVDDSLDSARDVSKSKVLILNRDPDSFEKTSLLSSEIYDIDQLLQYRGKSYEQEFIKGGQAYSVDAATKSNSAKIDILLSALKIPFVIHVNGGKLGGGWRGAGNLYVIVDRRNYREAAKVLKAAIKKGRLTNLPPYKQNGARLPPEIINALPKKINYDD